MPSPRSRASEHAESSTPHQWPFTVIDEAVHVLDTPAEPWGIQLELGLGGRLDDARLRDAVRQAAARHPMARARQLPARRTDRTWQWEIPAELDVDPVRVVHGADDATLTDVRDDLYSRPVPPVESPPFRLVLVHRDGEGRGDALLLNANHAAFDGFGCVRLLQSVARAYTGEDDPEPAVPLAEARDVLDLLAAPDGATRRRRFRMLSSKAADLVTGMARMASAGGRDLPGYGFHQVPLSREDTERLTEREDATVNDVLLAALHLAVEAWNDQHGAKTSRRIGVLVPVNLRPKEWQEDVVTNLVLDARVLTTAADRRDPAATLESVRAQGEAIKKGGGAALIEAIGTWTSLPVWAKEPVSSLLTLTGNRLVCTALLSNLGPLKAPPDFGPDAGPVSESWFSAPARMPCGLAVGAATLDGRLHISLRYRHPLLDREAAGRFGRQLLDQLERVAAVK
jgi:NRPS condensation-like uncharacterized protein